MLVSMCTTCMQVPLETRKGHWVTRNWSDRRLRAATWMWGPNTGLLQEQPVLLTPEPSLWLRGSFEGSELRYMIHMVTTALAS